jgi:hypothetical protein
VSDDLPRLTASPSIYELLVARADEDGRLPDYLALPDEEPAKPNGIKWAPGALDGVFGHHNSAGETDAQAAKLAALFTKAADKPNQRRLRRLLAGCTDSVLEVIDPMIERLIELDPPRAGVHRVARWLAETATERGPVKLGIALLGITGVGDAAGLLRTLGAHDEFTLYAAVAFTNGSKDGESEIFSLAKVVDGWGRIQCVERLRHTSNQAIRSWILRAGFRNAVMYEYLAYIAATTGGLLDALRGDVDRELLDAAGEIIEALISGGPAEDIDDWDDGADAIEAYLAVLTTRAETLGDYLGVAAVRDFLGRNDGWDERSMRGGWTATRRTVFEGVCADILERSSWRELATTALASSDRATSWSGQRVLRDLGVSTFEHHFAAIRADPHQGSWYLAWEQADGEGAERLVQLARDVLPLDDLASGAGIELGLGPERADRAALEWTLQELHKYPGLGGDLLRVGLRSPEIRSRNMSLRALELWPAEAWPDGAEALVTAIADGDPDEDVRARARELGS